MNDKDDIVRGKINLETAKVTWKEVERLFASGKVIFVDESLDLIEVGLCLTRDDEPLLKQWVDNKQVYPLTRKQAIRWHKNHSEKWATVVKPWVLVQD